MKTFQRLSEIVDSLRQRKIPRTDDLRYDAARLIAPAFPHLPLVYINISALSLAMNRLAVHELTGGAINLVHSADLRSIPDSPPRMMRQPWIVESARLDEPLWGNTVCLGGYELEGNYFLVGLFYPDGALAAKWVPRWGGNVLEITVEQSPLIDNDAWYQDWAFNAARFTLVLSLLLEAYGSPIVTRTISTGKRSKAKNKNEWAIRRIQLRPSEARRSSSAERTGNIGDRIPQKTMVQGHLRRVRHGPKSSKIRWQWIESYEARRWVAPKIKYKIS